MNKKYKEIGYIGNDIKTTVESLLRYKEECKLVCTEFNGVMLYSDTVTMDGAYKEITGETKAEFDKAQQEWHKEYERKEREHKENIPTLSEEWIKKGKEVLSEDKWEYWSKIVPIRLNDLYQGMELGCCLDIVKILNILNNNGTLDEAKVMIESQSHSGMSFRLVCSMVREFCDRGNEFVEYVK